jgi:hypothetical protein
MLDVPGWFESQTLPKAAAVVSPLWKIARTSGEARRPVEPARLARLIA